MKSLKHIMIAIFMLSIGASHAQIKNTKTENVKIYGNCDMCEKTIERAGSDKKIAQVDWNKDTQIATISYDTKKTNLDEILKRIALSGYDSEQFLAPDEVYAKLPECCLYERKSKPIAKVESRVEIHKHSNPTTLDNNQKTNQLKIVLDNYFSIKDALIKSDTKTTAAQAKDLLNVLNTVQMDRLSNKEHNVWMKVMKDLIANSQKIATQIDLEKQRETLAMLSIDMYELAKVTTVGNALYYQHCPMYNKGKGANWLSKEPEIKNPYYGSQMLTCGSVQEIIK